MKLLATLIALCLLITITLIVIDYESKLTAKDTEITNLKTQIEEKEEKLGVYTNKLDSILKSREIDLETIINLNNEVARLHGRNKASFLFQ